MNWQMKTSLSGKHCSVYMYRINVSQFAVDVLAEFHQHVYRICQGKVKTEEKREKALGKSRIL